MERYTSKIQNLAYLLIAGVLFFYTLNQASFIIVPLVWSMFIALALFPLSNWLEEKRIPRGLAIALTLIMVTGIAFLIIYSLLNQVVGLLTDIPEISSKLQEKFNLFSGELFDSLGLAIDSTFTLNSLLDGNGINHTLFETGKSLTLAGIIPLFIFLMLFYKDFFMEFINKITMNRNSDVLQWINDSGKVIQSYLLGMLLVTGIVSLISGTFFYFIGIKYFVLFAVFIAVMNLIPYVGVVISSFLVVVYVLLTNDSMFYPIFTLAFLWFMQVVENNLITPLVVGSKVNVNTLAVVLAILIGGSLWGISGMILFIPLTGVLKITLDRIPGLEPYGYLLGDKFPVNEKFENFWKVILRKFKSNSNSG